MMFEISRSVLSNDRTFFSRERNDSHESAAIVTGRC